MITKSVAFFSEGSRLVGDVYYPSDVPPGRKRPGIVLCHGYTGIKDLYLPDNARLLTQAGYVAMTFDYKGWGESAGPRSRLAPYSRVADVQAALTFLGTLPEVDAERLGLYGTIIVGPRGARYRHPVTGEDISLKSGWRADVYPPSGPPYRDFALFIQDEDVVIGTAVMPYFEHVRGVVGLNYRADSLRQRLAKDGDPSKIFRSEIHGNPGTPLLEAFVGDSVKIHVLLPASEQPHVFSLEGHQWPLELGRQGSNLLSAILVGGMEALSLTLAEGAGGRGGLPGTYLYGDHREPYREAGLWGIFQVHPRGAPGTKLRPLSAP